MSGSPDSARASRFGQVASILSDCTSTQDIVRAAAPLAPEGFLCVAEHQTAGRGRRGRGWESAPGRSLLFSLLLRPRTPPAELAPLALVAGIAIAESLPIPAQVRWPNDVVAGAAKIAGIVAELETPPDRAPFVVLGVGINVNVAREDLPATDRLAATSLLAETGFPSDRLALLVDAVGAVQTAYREFDTLGFSALRDRYAALDALEGRRVELALGDTETLAGVAAGVDGAGRLVIRDDDGSERRLSAGEVVRVGGGPSP